MRMSLKEKSVFYVLLIVSAILIIFPIFYTLSISLMSQEEIMSNKIFPSKLNFQNYIDVFSIVPLLTFVKNSLIVSGLITVAKLLTSAMAAYAFSFLKFKGRSIIFMIFISTMLIPGEVLIVPNFLTVQQLDWINDIKGLTIPFFASTFGIFLLRQHFLTVPTDLKDAAQIEGVGHWGFLIKIVVPYCRSGLIALSLFEFISSWNMYLWPLLVTNSDRVRTVQIGIKALQTQEVLNNWGIIMAGVVIIMLPSIIIIIFGQKYFQQGLTQGAVK